MGYIHEFDVDGQHEGWVAMTYVDGAVSSGTSNGFGHYLDGYTYAADGGIDPTYLRPFNGVIGWLPKCECGWSGVEVPVTFHRIPGPPSGEQNQWREPTDEQEDLIMYQWRLHMRDAVGAYRDLTEATR